MAYSDDYKRTIIGRANSLIGNARKRCKEKGIELQITQAWIEERLTAGVCEITGLHFCFEPPDEKATRRWDAPSLDRIDKDKPYSEDNTRVILWAVNCALSEYGTKIMLPILKAMVKGIESAQAKSVTPVSAGDHIQGAVGAELGSVSTPWTWEDSHDLDHYQRTVQGKDADYCTQARGGDGVGYGTEKVGTPSQSEGEQNNRKPPSPIIWP